LFAVLFLVEFAEAQQPDHPRQLILVAGQSNAVGFDAKPTELPPNKLDKDVMFWWRCGDPLPDEHDSIGATWSHLQPQPLGTHEVTTTQDNALPCNLPMRGVNG